MITNPGLPEIVLTVGPSGDTSGVDDRTAIAAAIADLPSGGIVQLLPGTYHVDELSALAETSGIWLRGSGDDATALIFTSAGGTADLTGASFFTCSDLYIRPSVQRTAEFFHLDAGTNSCERNRFHRLRVGSPYRLATLLTTTLNRFADIDFIDYNTAWGYNAGISLDGTTTSTTIRGISANLGSSITNAIINVTGTGVDTLLGSDWDFTTNGGASATGLNITAGEWIRLTNISLEGGAAAHGAVISGTAKGISINGIHALGLHGLHITGGKGIEIHGGEIVGCQQEGVYVSALSSMQDLTVANLDVSDCGLAATNTYPAIHFTGGFSYFKALGCAAGNNRLLGSANRVSYGIQVDTGSDYYVLANNQCEGATGGVLDNGGGTHKIVSNI